MTHILVIEDDAGIADSIAQVLKLAGYTVEVAVDGMTGIEASRTCKPDLILCDLMMPILSGYEVLKAIKADSTSNTIPIILVSALSERIQQRRGMELGADDYLTKPFEPEELIAAVQAQIEKHHSLIDHHEMSLRLMRNNITYALPHELRTPLSQIMGFAQLLEMETDPVDIHAIHDYATHITEASERLQHFIENYLVYAQLEILASSPEEMEKLHHHRVPDASLVIAQVAVDRANRHQRANDLELNVVPTALYISEENLGKIIGELTDNAFKFSTAGKQVLIQGTPAEKYYQLSIRDYGRGMQKEQLKLLDAYIQFDRAVHEQQGIGLGFAIAKRLVEIYGGTINPDSNPNAGTTVSMTFAI